MVENRIHIRPESRCPTCGEVPARQCACIYGDAVCKNGHHWHKCIKHRIIVPHQLRSHNVVDNGFCTCNIKVVTIP